MEFQHLVTKALSSSTNAIAYEVSRGLAALYPHKVLIEGIDESFKLQHYAYANLCEIKDNKQIHNQALTSCNGMENKIYKNIKHGSHEVIWQEQKLDVLLLSWVQGSCNINYYWILADSKELGESFFTAVCNWNIEIRKEVLVFDGQWYKDADLFESIGNADLENLVLRDNLKKDIVDNLTDFFASREDYEQCGAPWKRGILFTGSPGNGKTHTIKALINHLEKPCLYVKSFKSPYGDNVAIRQVFQQARRSAPCILVLEDLDSLINKDNRSFFLNELDGFANHQGVLTLATTNHPEDLDPAISERPSRFDRKYNFELPGISERQIYIKLWNNSKFKKPEMHLSDEAVNRAVVLTEGFSFAYLKELLLSSTMRWIREKSTSRLENMMFSELAILQEQISHKTVRNVA